MASRRRFIASGAAGCVVTPALSNEGREFPDQVTKMYVDRQSQSSVKAAAYAVATNTKLGKMGFRRLVFPYKEPRTFAQLPEELQTLPDNSCRLEYRKASDKPIGMTHMPNLGTDFIEIRAAYVHSLNPKSDQNDQAKTFINEIRAVPFDTIMKRGVGAMLQSLVILYMNGKIHRDVRLENTMFNPKNGTMTLIDFDMMVDKKDKEELAKWSIPPRLMTAYLPEMALWNTTHYMRPDSPSDLKLIDDMITFLLQPDSSFNKCTDSTKNYIIKTFSRLLAIWKRQLNILVDLYASQSNRISLSYLFTLSKESDERMAKFLLIGMGEYMDQLTKENILDVKQRKAYMRQQSFEMIDSFCMSFCIMVFLGIYLDDAKWAEHGATLDQLFENVLIPLYKFSVYPTHDMSHTRSTIQEVMDAISDLYPDGVPPLSQPLPAENAEAPPSPVKHKVITKRYKQMNIRSMFKPLTKRKNRSIRNNTVRNNTVRNNTVRNHPIENHPVENHPAENHPSSKENTSKFSSRKRPRATGGTRR